MEIENLLVKKWIGGVVVGHILCIAEAIIIYEFLIK